METAQTTGLMVDAVEVLLRSQKRASTLGMSAQEHHKQHELNSWLPPVNWEMHYDTLRQDRHASNQNTKL